MTTLWDTTGSAVVKELAAQRRTGGAVLSGVALTLVVVADESRVTEAEEAATHAAEAHPCRHAGRRAPPDRGPGPAPRRRGAHRRAARPRRGRGHAHVRPARRCTPSPSCCRCWPPTPRWSPGGTPLPRTGWPPTRWRSSPTGGSPTARIAEDPLAALKTRADDYAPGDTDLAWTRSTAWRAILASTLDSVSGRRGEPVRGRGGPRRGRPGNADRPAAGRLAVLPVRLPGRRRGRRPEARRQRRRLGRPAAGPGRGGADRRPTAGAARSSPSPTGPTPPSPCPTACSATCSARSCAGWTPTSPTARRWRRRPA